MDQMMTATRATMATPPRINMRAERAPSFKRFIFLEVEPRFRVRVTAYTGTWSEDAQVWRVEISRHLGGEVADLRGFSRDQGKEAKRAAERCFQQFLIDNTRTSFAKR